MNLARRRRRPCLEGLEPRWCPSRPTPACPAPPDEPDRAEVYQDDDPDFAADDYGSGDGYAEEPYGDDGYPTEDESRSDADDGRWGDDGQDVAITVTGEKEVDVLPPGGAATPPRPAAPAAPAAPFVYDLLASVPPQPAPATTTAKVHPAAEPLAAPSPPIPLAEPHAAAADFGHENIQFAVAFYSAESAEGDSRPAATPARRAAVAEQRDPLETLGQAPPVTRPEPTKQAEPPAEEEDAAPARSDSELQTTWRLADASRLQEQLDGFLAALNDAGERLDEALGLTPGGFWALTGGTAAAVALAYGWRLTRRDERRAPLFVGGRP